MSVHIPGDPPMRLLMAFQEHFPDLTPDWIVRAPGREMWIAAAFNTQPSFTIANADLDVRATFSYRSAKTRTTVLNRPLPGWTRYPAGTLLLLRDLGMEKTGLHAVLTGGEPPGPRYDHAMGIAIAALWYAVYQRPCDADDLIELVEQVRREYVEV